MRVFVDRLLVDGLTLQLPNNAGRDRIEIVCRLAGLGVPCARSRVPHALVLEGLVIGRHTLRRILGIRERSQIVRLAFTNEPAAEVIEAVIGAGPTMRRRGNATPCAPPGESPARSVRARTGMGLSRRASQTLTRTRGFKLEQCQPRIER
jgi:hypothetical protein